VIGTWKPGWEHGGNIAVRCKGVQVLCMESRIESADLDMIVLGIIVKVSKSENKEWIWVA
jgi:hypothetical protein